MTMKDTSIVDGHFLLFASSGVNAFFDKCFGDSTNVGDAAVEPDGRVDTVGEQIARQAGSGFFGIETPSAVSMESGFSQRITLPFSATDNAVSPRQQNRGQATT
jgi:hypothetical protein